MITTGRANQVFSGPDRAKKQVVLWQHAKRYLPPFLRTKLLVLNEAVHHRLYRRSHFRLLMDDLGEKIPNLDDSDETRMRYKHVLIDWLVRAQDAAQGGGVAGYYSFAEGWSAAYPETTGYIITTVLEAEKRLNIPELAIRARRMADWEVEIQLPDGAWQSGFINTPRVPAVFNTGQVIEGLLSAYSVFQESRYLEAAERGGRWLLDNQDEDGAWRRHTYNSFPNSYSTRVAWPLLSLANATGDRVFRLAAIRYLEWAAQCQDEAGWFDHCSLEVGDNPLTHTLGYTVEGFIESGAALNDERWISIGQRTADALLHRYEIRRHLAGTYDKGWRGDHSFACLTGCAQMSRVWGRLYELRNDVRYLNAALKINDYVMSLIDLKSDNPGIRGGVKGSHPVWGSYMKYRLPSWAAKFTLDALFQEDNALRTFWRNSVEHRNSVRASQ